jgi:hypothetical protein
MGCRIDVTLSYVGPRFEHRQFAAKPSCEPPGGFHSADGISRTAQPDLQPNMLEIVAARLPSPEKISWVPHAPAKSRPLTRCAD